MVQLNHLVYAGSHGFDIKGPGQLNLQQQEATQALPELDEAEQKLRGQLQSIAQTRVERKRFALAVHYREVTSDQDVARVENLVDAAAAEYPSLRKRGGKKIFELQPNVAWDKGQAVLWLIQALELDSQDTVVIYVGDDETDEDAFRALQDRALGFSVRVAPPGTATDASYYVPDCSGVKQLLGLLLGLLTERLPA
jgi:alpha,alpha-trehalase